MATLAPISTRQAHYFRLCRTGVYEPLGSAQEVASRLIGVQAQLVPAAGLAIGTRTRQFREPQLRKLLVENRKLIKLWGQRNTLHLYVSEEWPLLFAGFRVLPTWQERRLTKEQRDLGNLHSTVRMVAEKIRPGGSYARHQLIEMDPNLENWIGYGHGIVMDMVRAGLACHAEPMGGQAQFAHRETWLPDLEWTPASLEDSAQALCRGYFRAYGPATIRDFAFWLGARVATAREWCTKLGRELVPVDVDGTEMLVLQADLEELSLCCPTRSRWPVKLLYRFDPTVLAHKDKSWLITEENYKRVWRAAAHVEAVILSRGRITGTWRYDKTSSGLTITLSPFDSPGKGLMKSLESRAQGIAKYFGLPLRALRVSS